MADIFVSYASKDRDLVKPLVEALMADGWSVWWDLRIGAGATFDREIERELDAAKCVVVVWSKNAIDSEYVRNEAHEGYDQNKLVPLRIDDVKPPLAFRRLQVADLVEWPTSHGDLEMLRNSIRICIQGADTEPQGTQESAPPKTAEVATTSTLRVGLSKHMLTSLEPFGAVGFLSIETDGHDSIKGFVESVEEAVCELLVSAGAPFGVLRFLGRTETRHLAGKPLTDIAAAIDANVIVHGSARLLDDQLRLTVEISNNEGVQSGISRHRIAIQELFNEEDQLVDRICMFVLNAATNDIQARIAERKDEELGPWGLFFRGQRVASTPGNNRRNWRQYFERAITLDPAKPAFFARFALGLANDLVQGRSKAETADLALATDMARIAIDIPGIDAQSMMWVARCYGLIGRRDEAVDLAQRAYLRYSRTKVAKTDFAGVLLSAGRAAEALDLFNEGLQLRVPGEAGQYDYIALCHLVLGNTEDALAASRRAVDQGASTVGIRGAHVPKIVRASCLANAGLVDEARTVIDALRSDHPAFSVAVAIRGYERIYGETAAQRRITAGLRKLIDVDPRLETHV